MGATQIGDPDGVLQHLEAYAKDPRKITLDEEKAGQENCRG
jgi:hypothetical protein